MRHSRSTAVPFFVMLMLSFTVALPKSLAQNQASPLSPNTPESQQDHLCTVAGTVTSLATGEPLKKVEITLSVAAAVKNQPRAITATTDANGQFSIEHVLPGRYLLSLSRDGYLSQRYAQQDGEGDGAVLNLVAGEKMTDLIFRLQKTAVITGRVVDEDGEPMARVEVEVMRRRRINGSLKLLPMGAQQTDDLGNYRVFGLVPGRYLVRANLNPQIFWVGRGDDEEESSQPKTEYATTYYPGTTDAARASAIDVKAGDEIPRIDFFLTPRQAVKTYRIRGHLTNQTGLDLDDNITLMAVPRNSEEDNPWGHSISRPDRKTGDFVLMGLAPGSYTVAAMTFAQGKTRMTTQQVEITDADVDSVSLVLTRGADIPGRLAFDGQLAASSESLSVLLEARSSDSPFARVNQAEVKSDGSFTLTEVGDGIYSVHVASKCNQCYLKSATSNGVDLLAQGLSVSSGSGPNSIDLVYSSNTGKATGTVTGADDLPVPGAYVLLVNDDTARSEDRLDERSATSDQNGNFEITGIPPGRYRPLAFQKLDPDSASDPDLIKPLAAKADSIDVSANSTVTLQLKSTALSLADQTN